MGGLSKPSIANSSKSSSEGLMSLLDLSNRDNVSVAWFYIPARWATSKSNFGKSQVASCESLIGICRARNPLEAIVLGAFPEAISFEEQAEEKYRP